MLTVVTLSTDEDLTTTGAVKEMVLGATATSTAQDAYLARMARRGAAWAESYIGAGALTVQTYRETVPGYGSRTLMLSRTPVRAVLAIYNATDTDDAVQLNTSEFFVEDREAGLIARNAGFGWTVPLQWRGAAMQGGDAIPLDPQPMSGQENRPWLVDYVAGWTYDGLSTSSANYSTVAGTTSTGRTVPYDVEQAVILRAQTFAQNRGDVQAEQLGDLSVTYNSRSVMRDSDALVAEGMLGPYRRIV